MSAFFSKHWPALVWSPIVGFLLLAPGDLEGPDPAWLEWFAAAGGDKIVHAVLFFVQAWVLERTLRHCVGGSRPVWIAALLAAVYGLVLELAQMGVAGRSMEVSDVVANAAGAGLWVALRSLLDLR